jgi:succinate dehydrogenase/fumarate reductase flavoprotein subunit
MGGVRTDDEGQTALDGLFACGEAVWGLHGANRRGGNALTECIVWGMFAGQNAARHALETQAPHPKPEESDDSDFPKASGRMRYRELRRRIKEIATASELRLRQDMMSASFVLRAILLASLARQESRGAFMREDFPQEDNVNWQKNSCLRYEPKAGVFSISHQETKV